MQRQSKPKPTRKKGKSSVVIQQEVVSHHSGPLPAPNDFAAYNEVIPGAAERILRLAEIESEHRRNQEKKAMERMHRETLLGQIFALTIGLSGILASVYLAVIDQVAASLMLGGGTLVALVTAFIKGRS
ncbi:MAG: DUF2335 domain-containing protein [Mariprofundaceae bacterium]|nr:DUF2335 domain-containing protein [Mariprofundaceae bacterium]